jgi:hypothetical protein
MAKLKRKKKLTDIGFYCLAFKDIEIFYWTVDGHWMVLRADPHQSTSRPKIG